MPQENAFPEPNQRPDRGDINPVAGRIEAAVRDSYSQAPALSSTPNVGDLLRSLRRRWMAAVALGGTLAAIAAVAVWYLMTPEHTAFAQIRVLSAPVNISGDAERVGGPAFMTYLRAQSTQFKSRPVIMAALKRDEMKRLNLEALHGDPILYIEERLKAEIQDGSEFMTPRMAGTDPNELTTIVKALTAAYMDEVVYAEQRVRVTRVAELEKAYNETQESLNSKRANLDKLAKDLGTTSNDKLTLLQQQVLDTLKDDKQSANLARSELMKAQALLDAREAQKNFLKDMKLADVQVEAAIKLDPAAADLKVRVDKCKDVVSHYLVNAVDPQGEPTYRAALRLQAELEGKLVKRRDEVKAELLTHFDNKEFDDHDLTKVQLANTIASIKQYLNNLETEIKELMAKAEKFPTSNELESLRNEIEQGTKLVNELGERKQKQAVELRSSLQRISVYQEAELEKRDTKKQLAATIAAPLAVFGFVCLGLSWLEYRQRRIHTAGEVSHGLGIHVVGSIPNHANLARCLVGVEGAAEMAGQPVMESIDAIRTLLLYQAQTASTRVVMVTSAAEGEGKTTLASHLAGSLARAGRKTLLIDADLRQPAVHQLFETPLQPGFSEVLLGEVEVADSIQATTIDGLSIIAAGQWDREVIQSLARGGMEGVFEKLREEFDFIIVDSHPVLSATDALLIGQHSDAVLISVLKQVSQMPRVYTACQRLTSLNIRVLGAVVSGTDPEEVFSANNYNVPVEQL